MIDDILEFNKKFVESKGYEKYICLLYTSDAADE